MDGVNCCGMFFEDVYMQLDYGSVSQNKMREQMMYISLDVLSQNKGRAIIHSFQQTVINNRTTIMKIIEYIFEVWKRIASK